MDAPPFASPSTRLTGRALLRPDYLRRRPHLCRLTRRAATFPGEGSTPPPPGRTRPGLRGTHRCPWSASGAALQRAGPPDDDHAGRRAAWCERPLRAGRVVTPGHGPTRPMPSARSCSRRFPVRKPSTQRTGRALLRPEACFRPNQPRPSRRVSRHPQGRNARGAAALARLDAMPDAMAPPSATIWSAARSGAARTFRCGGNRLHSYIRPVRAGLRLLDPMVSARPAPHPCDGLRAPWGRSGLAGRGLTCLPSHRLVLATSGGGLLCFVSSVATSAQARWPAKFGLYSRSWANKAHAVRAVLFASATAATFSG